MNRYSILFDNGTMESIEAVNYQEAVKQANRIAGEKETAVSSIIGEMNHIEYDSFNGIREVSCVAADIEMTHYCCEDYAVADRLLSETFQGVRGMIVSDDVFAWIDRECGIKKIKQGE